MKAYDSMEKLGKSYIYTYIQKDQLAESRLEIYLDKLKCKIIFLK